MKLQLTKKSRENLYNLCEVGTGVIIIKTNENELTYCEFGISRLGKFVTMSGEFLIKRIKEYENLLIKLTKEVENDVTEQK